MSSLFCLYDRGFLFSYIFSEATFASMRCRFMHLDDYFEMLVVPIPARSGQTVG